MSYNIYQELIILTLVSTVAHHCVIIIKQKFQQLKTVDRPFQWSINYGISTYLAWEMSSLKSLIFNISKKAASNSLNFLENNY